MTQLFFGFDLPPEEARKRSRGAARPRAKSARPALQLSLLADLRSQEPQSPQEPPSAPGWRDQLRGKSRLETVLRQHLGPEVLVSLTSNFSTMISSRRKGRALYVRVHEMFVDAPEAVHGALAAFVANDRIGPRDSKLLDQWVERHRSHLREARVKDLTVVPQGECHDLCALFDHLNQRYFAGRILAQVTWTRAARKQRRRSIHLGTYSDELRLIRIHPALDQPFVPSYFVEFVLYHEMLHQVHGAPGAEGCRREVHSPAFRAEERRFERYQEAIDWERRNLAKLLKY